MSDAPRKLFLLDGMALVYRAYFAFLRNPRITSAGLNTSAVFGYATTVMDLLSSHEPTHLAVVFDTSEPTFRHLRYPEYKAHRQETPPDLRAALPHIDRLNQALRIPVLRVPGFEADDVIGCLARRAERDGFTTYMVTPDKDFAQLVDEHTFIYRPPRGGGKAEVLGIHEVCEEWQIRHCGEVIEVLGLMGDSSDNVPGVPGVGEKTATSLVARFGSIAGVYEHLDDLKGKQRETLAANRGLAELSRELVTICTEVPPLQVSWDDLLVHEADLPQVRTLFAEFEFKGLGQKLFGPDFVAAAAPAAAATAPVSPEPAASEPQGQLELGLEVAPALATAASVRHSYRLADTPARRQEFLALLGKQKAFCFDLETTDLEARHAECVGVAFSWKAHEGWFVPCPEDQEATRAILAELAPCFAAPQVEKVGHNLKYDIAVLKRYGIAVADPLFDTMLAHYLIEPEGRHGMDYLAQTMLGYNPIPITQLIGSKKGEQKNMRQVPVALVAEYSAEDADVTWQLREKLMPLLRERNAEAVFRQVEAPLVNVLVDMEAEGVGLDVAYLQQYAVTLESEIAALRTAILEQAGIEFNLDSPKQLGELLFDRLKLDPEAKRTDKTGQYATSEDVLQPLANRHLIVRNILDYRELRKLKNTYVDTLPAAVDPQTGRVHTHFSQAVTATGRLQSANPNLQNIPIRSERGQEIRRAFVARGPEWLLLSADYSQIELRVIAQISTEENMIAAFHAGLDIHQATAARIFHVDLDQVTPEMRRRAKMVNFGIPYGISAFGLAERLGCPRGEARALIDDYFAQFPRLRAYIEASKQFAREHGYVETMLGRRRYLRRMESRNANERQAEERNAINAPIQGTAADMIKLAMVRIHARLRENGCRTRMLLQVHDELLFDLHRDEQETVVPMILAEMRQAIPMQVPIEVQAGSGANWLEAH